MNSLTVLTYITKNIEKGNQSKIKHCDYFAKFLIKYYRKVVLEIKLLFIKIKKQMWANIKKYRFKWLLLCQSL